MSSRDGEYIRSIWHSEKGKCNGTTTTDYEDIESGYMAGMYQGQKQPEVSWVGLAERSAIIVR